MCFIHSGSKAICKKQLLTMSIWNNLISDATSTVFQDFFLRSGHTQYLKSVISKQKVFFGLAEMKVLSRKNN